MEKGEQITFLSFLGDKIHNQNLVLKCMKKMWTPWVPANNQLWSLCCPHFSTRLGWKPKTWPCIIFSPSFTHQQISATYFWCVTAVPLDLWCCIQKDGMMGYLILLSITIVDVNISSMWLWFKITSISWLDTEHDQSYTFATCHWFPRRTHVMNTWRISYITGETLWLIPVF